MQYKFKVAKNKVDGFTNKFTTSVLIAAYNSKVYAYKHDYMKVSKIFLNIQLFKTNL